MEGQSSKRGQGVLLVIFVVDVMQRPTKQELQDYRFGEQWKLLINNERSEQIKEKRT